MVTIEEYEPAYADQVLALLTDAGPTGLTLREDITRGSALTGYVYLALTDDNLVIGVLEGSLGSYCAEAPPGFSPPHARITLLEVTPTYRQHGIGRQLVAAFAAHAAGAGRGFLAASVLTDPHETSPVETGRAHFYNRCGMPALIWSEGRHEVGGPLAQVVLATCHQP